MELELRLVTVQHLLARLRRIEAWGRLVGAREAEAAEARASAAAVAEACVGLCADDGTSLLSAAAVAAAAHSSAS